MKYRDKARGMLLGLAVGDALGAPTEFLPAPSHAAIEKLGDEIEHFHKSDRGPAGAWTDDTSQALCIADSLIKHGGYDSYDIMLRFYKWVREGYRACPDTKFDIGEQTKKAIIDFAKDPVVGRFTEKVEAAGNAPIMRLAPIVIANTFPKMKYPTLGQAFRDGTLAVDPGKEGKMEFVQSTDVADTLKMAALSCRETHDSIAAIAVTEMFATELFCALHGLSKPKVINYAQRWMRDDGDFRDFTWENMDALYGGIEGDGSNMRNCGGYIVDAFRIANWAFLNSDSYAEGVLKVIRLGGDTDTNAAIYGQLAGAYYGYKNIPREWRKRVYLSKEIISLADSLLAMTKCPIKRTRFESDPHYGDPK